MLFWRKHKKRTHANTPKIVLIKQAFIGIALMGSIVLIGTGIWHSTRIDALTITSVAVQGGETISHDEIRRIVEEHISGTYFKLVPHRFAWTYPEQTIISALYEKERIRDLHVVRTSGTEISITFSEYRPSALWCTAVESANCLFLDEQGYAFTEAPQLTGSAFIRYSDPNRQPEVGSFAFDGETQLALMQFADIVEDQFGFAVFHIEQSGTEEVTYYTHNGGALKVSQRMSLEDTVRNLETVLTSTQFEHLESGNFQYIDLRYGDKVFVNEETPVSDDDTAIAATDSIADEETEVSLTAATSSEEE